MAAIGASVSAARLAGVGRFCIINCIWLLQGSTTIYPSCSPGARRTRAQGASGRYDRVCSRAARPFGCEAGHKWDVLVTNDLVVPGSKHALGGQRIEAEAQERAGRDDLEASRLTDRVITTESCRGSFRQERTSICRHKAMNTIAATHGHAKANAAPLISVAEGHTCPTTQHSMERAGQRWDVKLGGTAQMYRSPVDPCAQGTPA